MGPMAWQVLPSLAAIARHVAKGDLVNASNLSSWVQEDNIEFTPGVAEMALTALQRRGWCSITGCRRRAKNAINEYRVTPAGMQAAQVALRCMPGGPVPDCNELETRLWNLMRIRRRLTAEEAAQTLVDADTDFVAKKKRIGALLAAWAKFAPTAVTTGMKREAGHIRYVLTEDWGRWPLPSKEGQMHPVMFANAQAIPARFRRTAEADQV